jgi:phosphatidylserine decarboxylase
MKHKGKAYLSARRMIGWTLVLVLVVFAGGLAATVIGPLVTVAAGFLVVLWAIFAVFTLYFFRDPNPRVPKEAHAIVSPAHGKVDLIEEIDEPEFIQGPCRRVSIFLSIFSVHVQNAPVAGKLVYLKHRTGQFLNAMQPESAQVNENVYLGFESNEAGGEKIGVRLIAGLIARRIIPWVQVEDVVERGERISLIQFGSRCDVYLPPSAKIQVKLGDKVAGGQTVLATRA